jgi:hypothetical protein
MPLRQQPVDSHSSAQSFEGKITKPGDKLVLQDASIQATYQLDDQDKAKPFKGQNVKITATMDLNTNFLHGVDIAPSESKWFCDTSNENLQKRFRINRLGFKDRCC